MVKVFGKQLSDVSIKVGPDAPEELTSFEGFAISENAGGAMLVVWTCR